MRLNPFSALSRFIPSGVLNVLRVLRVLTMLRFIGIFAVWTLILWFVLPRVVPSEWLPIFDVSMMSPRTLLLMHAGPPAVLMSVWHLVRRLWRFRGHRLSTQTAAATVTHKGAKRKTAEAEHEAALSRRRACLECRGIAVAALKEPDWYDKGQVFFKDLAATPDVQSALASALEEMFKETLMTREAVTWLPIYIVRDKPELDETLLAAVKDAWKSAINGRDFTNTPLEPVCTFLPQSEDLPVDRVFSLFEDQSPVPGLVLIGGTASQTLPNAVAVKNMASNPGFAIVGVVLSRPDLQAADAAAAIARDDRQKDPYTPYWERQTAGNTQGQEKWGPVPPMLQAGFLETEPLAILHRARTETFPKDAKGKARSQQAQNLLRETLIDATLHDWPFNPEPETAKDAKASETPASSDLPGIEIGGVVHNNGDSGKGASKRIVTLNSALQAFNCEWDPIEESCDVLSEHGNTGAASGMLILAEGFIRAAQLKKPVLMTRFSSDGNGNESMTIGFVRPPEAA